MIQSADIQLALQLIPKELGNTLYMVFAAGFFAFLVGLPLGILLWLWDRGGLMPAPLWHRLLAVVVNCGRSIPFAILMVAVIPLTRWVVGTSLGTTASLVPLTLAAAPFAARVVEKALRDIRSEIIDAALVMGSTTGQIVWKVMLPEAFPSLVAGATLTLVNLVGYSAMAGLVGGGGLGKIAIQYGYQRFNGFLMLVTLIILLLLVEVIEWGGKIGVRTLEKTRGSK